MLSVVGISYGRAWLTQEAIQTISKADTVIGYKPFVEQIQDLVSPKAQCYDVWDDIREHENFLMARVRHAIEQLEKGKSTVILSNGDVNIFGMSGAVYRQLDTLNRRDLFTKTKVIPGISAMQIAASHLGGPLSNGFATFALCIAEIPEKSVFKKIKACAEGDFISVAYMLRHNAEIKPELHPEIDNPRGLSNQRILKMIKIFLDARDKNTPCVIATGMGGDTIYHYYTLSELSSRLDLITANSIVFIGASDTLQIDEILVSPTW